MNPTTKNLHLLVLFLFFASICKAQVVNIPDPIFKAKLLAASAINQTTRDINGVSFVLDANGDSQIQISEALNVYEMRIAISNINDITGINFFSNLVTLRCNTNNLTSIDVSGLTNLQKLYCAQNQLTSLSSSNLNANLKELYCQQNSITNLNLTNNLNPNLSVLYCSNNLITNLDLSGMVSIINLNFLYNPINNLFINDLINLGALGFVYPTVSPVDLTVFPNLNGLVYGESGQSNVIISDLLNLQSLRVEGIAINNLTLSNMSNLISFELYYTNVTDLDLSGLKSLTTLDTNFNSALTSIYIKNGNTLSSVNISDASVKYVCSNENDTTIIAQSLSNFTTAHVNTYCSFVPGGDYNTITGTTIFDQNNNGCDIADQPFPFIKINYYDGSINYSTFTEDDGKYNLYTNVGNFTITPELENPNFYNVSPSAATISFVNNTNNTSIQDFCISPNGIHPDVEVVVAPIYPSVTGAVGKYQVVYRNKGTETLSGTVNLNYNDTFLDFNPTNSTNPDAQATGSLSWNYSNLKPFENRSIVVNFDVLGLTDEILNFSASISQNGVDEVPADNAFTYNEAIAISYDPIRITCLQGENIDTTAIGDYLHYIVNFDNLSTTPIENVVVKLEIDPLMFDINSLQVLNASNEVYARIKSNTAELIFKSANVGGPGGHGNILLKIRTNNLLLEGATIINAANVYFDYDAPVVTDDVTTTFANLKASVYELDGSISIYPNPSASLITINSQTSIKNIQLYDAQGRILQSSIGTKNAIDISEKAKGVYFLKITTSQGSKIEKVVKE
jgi:Leucine-rich repeat (LRR) protein